MNMGIDSFKGSEASKARPEVSNSMESLLPQLAHEKINAWSEEFEKNNTTRETPDQIAKHLATILRSYNIRKILADNHVAKKEMQEIKSIKLTEYEMGYLFTGGSYLAKLYPQKFQAMIQQETGIKDINQFIDTVSIELPDGRKKSLRLALIEQSHTYTSVHAGLVEIGKVEVESKLTPTKSTTESSKGAVSKEKTPVTDKNLNTIVAEVEKKQGKEFFSALKEAFKNMTPEQKRDFAILILSPKLSIVLHAKDAFAKLTTEEKKNVSIEMVKLFSGVIPGVKVTQLVVEKVLS